MATITKRGPAQWQAKIRRKGWPVQSKTFDTRADAEAWSREIESEIDRGIFRPRAEAERTTLAECLERYLREITPSKKGRKQETTLIKRWLQHPLSVRFMATLRGADMAAYRDERATAGASPTTINNELTLVSHLFTVATKEWGMESLRNPVAMIRRPKNPRGRDRRITTPEETALLGNAGPLLRVVIVLALETGMRRGEIIGLMRSDIDFRRRVVRLTDTKNGEQRFVPLSSRAVSAIESLPTHISGRVIPLSADKVTHDFADLCLKLEIHDLRLHDLRHEATSRLFELGLNIMEVAAITGHKTVAMLSRYTHLRADDLANKLG